MMMCLSCGPLFSSPTTPAQPCVQRAVDHLLHLHPPLPVINKKTYCIQINNKTTNKLITKGGNRGEGRGEGNHCGTKVVGEVVEEGLNVVGEVLTCYEGS